MANLIIEYYNWLIKELSKTGFVESKSVFNKIDEIMQKYNF